MALFWILVMILVPQVVMLHNSLWWTEKSKDAAAITLRIDELYNDVGVLELDLAAASDDEKAKIAADIEAKRVEIAELESKEVKAVRVYGLANYTRMSALHFEIFVKTMLYSAMVTVLALIVCYPIAFAAAQVFT